VGVELPQNLSGSCLALKHVLVMGHRPVEDRVRKEIRIYFKKDELGVAFDVLHKRA
jgi:hypothetical protein